MTTSNQSLSVNGQKLSNNDPDLVITLDDHPVVQISKIEEEQITYSFSGDVDQETTYNLNLTFIYKTTHRLVVPMTFIHKVAEPNLVITDVPLTVQMWQTGSQPTFKVEMGGEDVTADIKELTLGESDYVKPDSATTNPEIWEVLYADTAAKDTVVEFTFKYTKGGIDWAYTGEGTFKLPAWDGVAFKTKPDADFPAGYDKLRIKLDVESDVVYVGFQFKNNESATGERATDHDVLDGSVEVSETSGEVPEGFFGLILKALKTGTYTPKIAFTPSTLGGYPENTDKLTLAYWQPEVEIWEDALSVTPTTQTAEVNEGESVEVPLAFKWADGDANVPVNDAELSLAITPENIVDITSKSETAVTLTATVDVTEDTVENLTVTATYRGKTAEAAVDLTVKAVAPPAELTLTTDSAPVAGKQYDPASINGTLKYGDETIPFTDEGVSITSSDPSVLDIFAANTTATAIGLVFGGGAAWGSEGSVTLTITYNGHTATATVNYKVDAAPFIFLIDKEELPKVEGRKGARILVPAAVSKAGNNIPLNDPDLMVMSNDTNLFTIDKDASTATQFMVEFVKDVTADESGTMTITASYQGDTTTDDIPYTLKKPAELTYTPAPTEISGKKGDKFTMTGDLKYDGETLAYNADGLTITIEDVDGGESTPVTMTGVVTADGIEVELSRDGYTQTNGDAYFKLAYQGTNGTSATFAWTIAAAPSLTMALDPDNAEGILGDIIEIKPNLKYQGNAVDLTDPGVTVDDAPANWIRLDTAKTTTDTLTYNVVRGTVNSANQDIHITIKYSGETVVEDLKFTLNPEQVTVTKDSPESLEAAKQGTIFVHVADRFGEPWTGTIPVATWDTDPAQPDILLGKDSGLTAVSGTPGLYQSLVNVGHRPGTIKLSQVTINSNGTRPISTVTGVEWTTPGTALQVSHDVNEIDADKADATTVTVTVKQDRYGYPATLIPAITVDNVVLTGEGELVGDVTVVSDGVFSFDVKGNGTAGTITFTADIGDVNGKLDSISVELTSAKEVVHTLEFITNKTVSGHKGDVIDLPATLTYDNGDVPLSTEGVEFTLADNDLATLVVTDPNPDGHVSIQLVKDVDADESAEVVLTVAYIGLTDTDTLNITVRAGNLALALADDPISGYRGDIVPVMGTLNFNGTEVPFNDEDVTFEMSEPEKFEFYPGGTNDTTLGLKFLGESGDEVTGTLTVTATYQGKTASDTVDYTITASTLTYTADPKSIEGEKGNTVDIGGSILFNGAPVDFNSEGLTFDVTDPNDAITFGDTATATAIQGTFSKDVTEDLTGTLTVRFTYKGMQATDTVDYVHHKPSTLELSYVTKSLSGLKGDTFSRQATLLYNGESIPLNAAGVTLTSSDPDTLAFYTAPTDTRTVFRLAKSVTETETANITITASYKGLTATDVIAATTVPNRIAFSLISDPTLEQAKTNTIKFHLRDVRNNDVLNLADYPHTLEWAITPNSPDVSPGQASEIVDVVEEAGVYTMTVDVGHKAGTIALTRLTVRHLGETDINVSNLPTFTTTDVPLEISSEPTSIAADGDTPITLTVKQKRFPDQTETLVPNMSLSNVEITGNIVVKTAPAVTGDGTITLTLTGNGVAGTASIGALISDAGGRVGDLDIDLTVNEPFKLTANPQSQDITTDEQKEFNVPLTYTWSDGDVAVTPRQVALTFNPSSAVTLVSRSDAFIVLKTTEDITEQKAVTVTINAQYNGKVASSTLNLTVNPVVPDELTIASDKSTASGAINDEVVLTPELKFNDTKVALNDPDVVLTVTPSESVQLESDKTTANTLAFLVAKAVTNDTVSTITLTATYRGLTATDTLDLTIKPELINVELVSPATLTQAESNQIKVRLTNKDGNPFENATLSSINWKSTPNDPAVLAGWSNMLQAVDGEAGNYYTNLNVGHRAGKIDLDGLSVTSHSVAVPVQGAISFTTVDTPLIVTQDITDIDADKADATTVTVTVKQKRYATGDTLIPGITLSAASVTGEATLEPGITVVSAGVFTFKVKGKGTDGAAVFTATVNDDTPRSLAQITVGLTTTKEPVLTVTPSTQTKTVREDQTVEVPLTYTWTQGNTNVPVNSTDLGFVITPDSQVTIDSKTATSLILKPVAGTGDDTVHALNIAATYQGKSVSSALNLTITSLPKPTLQNVQSPLTMNLWDTTPLSFQVQDPNGNDITSAVTSVEDTSGNAITDKFEFKTISATSWGYQSVSSSTTDQVTAQATFNVHVTYNSKEYILPGTVQLITNVNNGEIPTNRFDAEME